LQQRLAGALDGYSKDEDISSAAGFGLLVVIAGFARFFDIVNGFLNRCRGAWQPICGSLWPA
jgi:hypothetical protein